MLTIPSITNHDVLQLYRPPPSTGDSKDGRSAEAAKLCMPEPVLGSVSELRRANLKTQSSGQLLLWTESLKECDAESGASSLHFSPRIAAFDPLMESACSGVLNSECSGANSQKVSRRRAYYCAGPWPRPADRHRHSPRSMLRAPRPARIECPSGRCTVRAVGPAPRRCAELYG